MNDEFSLVLLSDMLEELGECETKSILSGFSCPKNKDVENFLNKKAIMFSKQGVAQTHLIFCNKNGKQHFVGYFSLAIKSFNIGFKSLSYKMKRRLNRFVIYDKQTKGYRMSAVLIGQLGKNFSNNDNDLITGDKLLEFACQKVKEVQMIAGGKFVYLECEDKQCLKDFYSKNGFINFGKRWLDRDEKDELSGDYLIEMIKYL